MGLQSKRKDSFTDLFNQFATDPDQQKQQVHTTQPLKKQTLNSQKSTYKKPHSN